MTIGGVDTVDRRNRPVILESPPRRLPRPRTVLGLISAAILAAGGVAAGSWSVWFAVDATTPAGNQAPLWFSPPAPVPDDTPSTEDRPRTGHHRHGREHGRDRPGRG